jgi:AraC-like DNA-binding protein
MPKLIVKNMVCARCIASVEQILEKHDVHAHTVRLGEIEIDQEPDPAKRKSLEADLRAAGFELLDDQRKQLIEKIKGLLIQKVQSLSIEDHFSVARFLGEHIYKDYSTISKMFSEVEGITIEQFFILQKIEKTKELLVYNESSLGQIAVDLGYSSTQHLSNQFRKLTGMTPTAFRKLGGSHRKPLDQVSR